VDNGNAASLEPFQGTSRRAFGGLALLVVRGQAGHPGSIRIDATATGLRPAQATVVTE
jgi:beta-galactosidase